MYLFAFFPFQNRMYEMSASKSKRENKLKLTDSKVLPRKAEMYDQTFVSVQRLWCAC